MSFSIKRAPERSIKKVPETIEIGRLKTENKTKADVCEYISDTRQIDQNEFLFSSCFMYIVLVTFI